MRGRTDFSAELILVCNSLDAGGIERVVATLANEWVRRGRRVCVITLHDRRRLYRLDPTVRHVVIDRAGLNRLADLLRLLAALLRGGGPARFWLLSLLAGGLYRLSYKRLYRAYSAAVYAGEAFLLRRALRRVESPLVVFLGTPTNIVTLKACRGLKRRLVVPVNDAAALGRLARDAALCRRLGEAARARVRAYHLPRAVDAWESVLGLSC